MDQTSEDPNLSDPRIDLNDYLSRNIPEEIDKALLRTLYGRLAAKKCVLVGFNDYAKHLINLLPHQIVRIVDNDPDFHGVRFREFVVEPVSASPEETLLYVDGEQIFATQAAIGSAESAQPYKQDIVAQFHKLSVDWTLPRGKRDRLGEPVSMMQPDTVQFLRQVLGFALQFPGDVAEIGVWQGGSLWNIMRLMQDLGDMRHVYGFDAFDTWPRHFAEAVMCIDEIQKRLAFYSGEFQLYRGRVETTLQDCGSQQLCFLHIDMGYRKEILDWAVERMKSGGVIQLDNYGHAASWSAKFDRYFQEIGVRLIRVPTSYQALAIILPK